MPRKLAIHEAVDLHELLSFKTICAVKTKAMMSLASDPQLKALMQQDIDTSARHILELQDVIGKPKVTM